MSPASSEDFHTIPIIFSLRFIQPGPFCFSKLENQQKGRFADAIFRRRDMSFKDLSMTSKEGLGSEKIPLNALKIGSRPACLSPDTEDVLVLRMPSRSGRIAGFQDCNIFYVLWVDCTFGLYAH